MKRTTLTLCAASGLLLAGCAGGGVRLINPQAAHPPVPEGQVRMFLADDTVPAECERYAHFKVISDPLFESTPKAMAYIRRRAGKAGANAVQVTGMRNPSTARAVASVLLPELRWRRGEVVAYRCTEQARTVSTATAGSHRDTEAQRNSKRSSLWLAVPSVPSV